MGYKHILVALGMAVSAGPALAGQAGAGAQPGAPSAGADARYCLRVEPLTGSRVETVRCATRADWVELGVDIDKDWSREGVRVIGPAMAAS